MAYNFFPVDREQMYLFPPSLKDWVPEGDLSWFILDAVGEMDLQTFYEGYRLDGLGGKGYEPAMMVSLLLYSYCLGERSSRRIEWLCQRDVGFKVVAANQVPDHSSIARFRQDHEEKMTVLFKQVLRLCAGAGVVKVGVVAVDGTKIKGNAALDANRTKESIDSEVEKMFAEAAAKDEEEDRLLERVLDTVREILPEAQVGVFLGDAGYWSKAVGEAGAAGPELLVATTKDWKQRKAAREAPPPHGRIPKDLSARDRMERKPLTQRGRRLYKIRGKTVEPVFGQVKDARGCDRFMRRGKGACDSEWKLIAATHNLLKLYRSGKRTARKSPGTDGGELNRRPEGLKKAA